MEGVDLSDIEDVWFKEKTEEGLTDLPEDFYEHVAGYLAEISRGMEGSEELRRSLLEEELSQVLSMVQEIYFFRINKMMDSLFEGEEESLLEQERIAFDKVRNEFSRLRKELLEPVIRGESELRPPREKKNTLVLALSEISEPIVGSDMRYYGPFERHEILNVPEKTAELLSEQDLARILKTKEA